MKLGYISHEEHIKRYDIVVKEYEAKLSKASEGFRSNDLVLNERKVGNSTRLVDRYIQELFINKRVKIIDHHYDHNNDSNKRLFKIVLRRLDMEHGSIIKESKVKVDHTNFTIELIWN